MQIRFRRKSQAEWLLAYILVVSVLANMLTEFFRLPSAVKYTIDMAWVGLLVLMLSRRIRRISRDTYPLVILVVLFLLWSIFGFVLNYQSPLYYLWGLRNNIRYFVFFFACVAVLRERWAEGYLDFFDKLFWVNFPVVLFQYFVLHKQQDYLGGLFGVQVGCNGFMNIFLIVVITRSVLRYLHRQEKLKLCISKCVAALLIAVLSELKVFFVEILLLFAIVFLTTRPSYRKLLIGLLIVAGTIVGAQIVGRLFNVFEGWFSVESIWESLTARTGYTGRNDMNRLTAVPMVLEEYLTKPMERIFGLGLGNCDNASFEFLVTPFYRAHKASNYYWFSHAFMLLEMGIVGFGLYLLFFVGVFGAARRKEKRQEGNPFYCQMAKIMAIMSLIMIVYNGSMRTEAGYMMYFMLALPFVRSENQQGGLQNQ